MSQFKFLQVLFKTRFFQSFGLFFSISLSSWHPDLLTHKQSQSIFSKIKYFLFSRTDDATWLESHHHHPLNLHLNPSKCSMMMIRIRRKSRKNPWKSTRISWHKSKIFAPPRLECRMEIWKCSKGWVFAFSDKFYKLNLFFFRTGTLRPTHIPDLQNNHVTIHCHVFFSFNSISNSCPFSSFSIEWDTQFLLWQ